MNNKANVYEEVYTILQDLQDDEYEKIPNKIIETLDKNRNKEYIYELNEGLELKEHNMLPETKAILFNLFRDYLATPEQKQKIIKMQKEESKKIEQKKREKYNINVFANSKNEVDKINKLDIVKHKENKFQKIINKIKKFIINLL